MTGSCPACGQVIRVPHKDRADERIRDIQFLLAAGESTHQIARRVGISQASVARWLYRWDRPDLAVRFGRGAKTRRAS